MPSIFDVEGDNLDIGFVNLRAAEAPIEQELHDLIESMWADYEPYADLDFREGFARDLDARFWEMYLGCTLLAAGRTLLPVADRQRAGGQPDICVVEEGRRIWIEAIAPDEGAPGPDQIVRPVAINRGGRCVAAPERQAQLRTTSAFWTKSKKIAGYLNEGVIGPDDVRIIAISASRFGNLVSDDPPLIMKSLFPIGNEYVTVNYESGEIVETGFQPAPFIERAGGQIPRTAFLDERFSHVSGVLWSRVSLGNLSRAVRPLTFVHNPLAVVPLPERWGVWDKEYVTTRQGDDWQAVNILARRAVQEEPVVQA
jgi:hypothetical protein